MSLSVRALFPQINETHRAPNCRAAPNITQRREQWEPTCPLAYMDITSVKASDVDLVPFIIMISDLGSKRTL